VLYYGPLYFGTDATAKQVLFDSGSDVTWVVSSLCTSCSHSNKFSATTGGAVTTGTAGSITYVSNVQASGTYYTASVKLGSATATGMKVLLASSTNLVSTSLFTGVCGLTPSNISNAVSVPIPTVFFK